MPNAMTAERAVGVQRNVPGAVRADRATVRRDAVAATFVGHAGATDEGQRLLAPVRSGDIQRNRDVGQVVEHVLVGRVDRDAAAGAGLTIAVHVVPTATVGADAD